MIKAKKLAVALPLAGALLLTTALGASAATPVVTPDATFENATSALAVGAYDSVVDSSGNIYYVENGNKIFKVTPTGTGNATPFFTGSAGAMFQTIAIGGDGSLYVYDNDPVAAKYKIQKITPSATVSDFGTALPAATVVTALAVDSVGRVFAADDNAFELVRIKNSGAGPENVAPSADCTVGPISDLLVDASDNVYLACRDAYAVVKYTPGPMGAVGTIADFFLSPDAGSSVTPELALAGDSLYVSDYGAGQDAVWKVSTTTPANNERISLGTAGGAQDPWDVVVGADNNVYVAGTSNGVISRISNADSGVGTTVSLVEYFAEAGGTTNPTGLLITPGGSLYAVPSVTEKIVRFDLSVKAPPANPAPNPGTTQLPDGSYSATADAFFTGFTVVPSGVGPFQFSLSGDVPAGLNIDGKGVVNGILTDDPGKYIFQVEITDAFGVKVTQSYTIVLAANPAAAGAGKLPNTGADAGSSWLVGGAALALAASGVLGLVVTRRNRKNSAVAAK